jgi:hypothetical protein
MNMGAKRRQQVTTARPPGRRVRYVSRTASAGRTKVKILKLLIEWVK